MHSPYVFHTQHATGRADPSGPEDLVNERTCAMYLGQPHGALVTTASIINALEEATREKVLAELPEEMKRSLWIEQQQRAAAHMFATTRLNLPANAAAAQEMLSASGFLPLSSPDALAAASQHNYNLMKAAGIRSSGGAAAGHHHHPSTCTPMDYNLGARLSGVPGGINNNMSSNNPSPRNGFMNANAAAAAAVMGNYNNPANGFSTANFNQHMYPRAALQGTAGPGVGYNSQGGVPGGGGMGGGYNQQVGFPGGGMAAGYNPQGGVPGGGAVGMSVGYNSHGGPVGAAASSSHGFRPRVGGAGGMAHSPTLIGSSRQMSPAGPSSTNMNMNMNMNINMNMQQMEIAGLVPVNSMQFSTAAAQRFSALPPGAFPAGNSGQMLRQHKPMISTYLDDFKQGFPSKGLSVVSNHWWGSAEPAEKPADTAPGNGAASLSHEKDREDDDADGASLCKDTDGRGHPTLPPLVVIRGKEDKRKDKNDVLNSCRKVTRSRKLAAVSSKRALKSGIAKGYGQQKLGPKEAAILQFVFGNALPKQWSAAFPDNG